MESREAGTLREPGMSAQAGAPHAQAGTPSRRALLVATLALFLVWSNTFLVFEVLLTGPRAPMGWLDLLVARFTPVFVIAAAWLLLARRRETWAAIRERPKRVLLCGALSVPVYNGALYYAMERGVSGPVASLFTTLTPLWLVAIGAFALHEPIRRRQVAGVLLGLAGIVLVASAKGGGASYGVPVAVGAIAPLVWAVYSALTKPATRTIDPLVWTYLMLAVGSAPLLLLLPFHGGPQMLALDARSWALLLYLSLLANVFGNAVWSWLLRHLPASTVGITIFLNPPLTTASKRVLSTLFPASFTFAVRPREWIGGALALAGVALAVVRRPRAAVPERVPACAPER
jgi:drug/metabolite transporter (DMT)-like permease